MRILIVGDGKVGHAVAEELIREEHDVVMIDNDESVLQRTEDTLDVLCVHGSGADARTLMSAGVSRADIIIAATHSDETNMLCCLIAKKLGAHYAIARIRDPEYNESLNILQRELDIDMAVNPERATALEIGRLLRFPFATGIESFARGRVEMVEFRAHEEDAIVNIPVKDINRKLHGIPQVLYAAVERDGEVYIPNGDFVIKAGDKVHVAADMVTVTAFFRYLGKNKMRVRDVLILGGSRISYYLAKNIMPMGIHVSIMEINEKKAEMLSELLPEANIICGDGTDQDLLEQEGLSNMDAFVALSNRDEENLMTGLFASRQGVPKVVVKNNHVSYLGLINDLGLDSIISPKSITCSTILRYVRARVSGGGTKVEKLYRLMNGKAEALEFVARLNDPYIGVPIRDLNIRPHTLVAVIVRRGKVFVPFGNDHIEAGDNVVIIACEAGISDLNEVIRV
ncbi:MAG: Trk system potassium transporter TrkA [Clostridiales bacterium]|nr:Trk system potassium transporter TrkA [Clostridiales bacterium]